METRKSDTVKDKGERIRGSDLKLSEKDVLKSMPFFMRLKARIFGGVFGMSDPDNKTKRVLIVYIPSMWSRFYFKHVYKHKTVKGETNEQK